jgi:hypothetical protein
MSGKEPKGKKAENEETRETGESAKLGDSSMC